MKTSLHIQTITLKVPQTSLPQLRLGAVEKEKFGAQKNGVVGSGAEEAQSAKCRVLLIAYAIAVLYQLTGSIFFPQQFLTIKFYNNVT